MKNVRAYDAIGFAAIVTLSLVLGVMRSENMRLKSELLDAQKSLLELHKISASAKAIQKNVEDESWRRNHMEERERWERDFYRQKAREAMSNYMKYGHP